MLSGCETGVFMVQREILWPTDVTMSGAGKRAGVRPLFLQLCEPSSGVLSHWVAGGCVEGSRAPTCYSEKKLWLPDTDVHVSRLVVTAATVAVHQASSCICALVSGEGLRASGTPGKCMELNVPRPREMSPFICECLSYCVMIARIILCKWRFLDLLALIVNADK